MSRICVKNLPKHVVEDRLREFFSQKGEVTDAKLIRTKDGKSRQFGFVGFRSEREAEEALKFFNNSFMDTCRITCEIARKVGDPDIPRPWSRHTSQKQEKLTDERKVTDPQLSRHVNTKGGEEDSGKDDPQLLEFLEVMQPRVKSKLWANDALAAPPTEKSGKSCEKQVQIKAEGKKKMTSAVVKLDEISKENDQSSDDEASKNSRSVEHNEVVSDMDYFKSRVKKDWSESESGDDEGSDEDEDEDDREDDDDDAKGKFKKSHESRDVHKPYREGQIVTLNKDVSEEVVKEGSYENTDDPKNETGEPSSSLTGEMEVLETGRLFVRNLPYTATEDDLEEHFSKFGSVSQVHLVVDKDTKCSKGFAYVLYTLPESAARALEELDHSIFQGRLLHIMPAKQKHSSVKQEIDGSLNNSKTFKEKREEERKASEASGNTRAWNSLFMRSDTVVENIARKFGVSKSDLLDREATDLAVRLALGETQVIAETKKALVNAGVNIASLEEFATGKTEGVKRSNHVIIVKNLPYGSSESELANMFGKFGNLDKIILPPTKTLGLVVFLEPAEARAAFRGLAYKRYKDAPLYLEWAPADVLSQNPMTVGGANKTDVVVENDAKQHVEVIPDADIDPDRVESRSLFVKNLNFRTSEESLQKHFSENIKGGKILSVRVKKHLKNGKNVSMGFGFVEFDSVDTSTNACRDLQGTVLDGHALILQLCHAKKDEQALKKVERDQSSTKLIVRNVAFEATGKELRQLFSPFGQLKSLRLPKRFGNHRGFAFVEYVTKQEAQNALQALSNTHLYGRHLVLERAKEGESLEELRARTAAQFTDEQNGFQNPTKLSRKRKHMAVLDEGIVKFGRIAD